MQYTTVNYKEVQYEVTNTNTIEEEEITTTDKKTATKKKMKTPTKKKKKKTNNKEPLPPPKLKNADDNTVLTHGNCSCYQPYAYQVQYYDKPQPEYTPFHLTDQFLPKFKLPYGVVPSVDAICTRFINRWYC